MNDPEIVEIVANRDAVLERFSPLFHPSTVSHIGVDDFQNFLSFKNNKHWSSLERQKTRLCSDLGALRDVLSVAVDEAIPLRERVDHALQLNGMGIGTLSAILLVAYPKKYGVWNGTSQQAMSHFGLWPTPPRGATKGDIYASVNTVLVELADEMGIDLWTLDALWWRVEVDQSIASDAQNRLKNKSSKIRIFDNKQKAIWEIKNTVINTVKYSNGQSITKIVKNKELHMTEYELELHINNLIIIQEERCAITGLKFQFDGDDLDMSPSMDRIDSNGHYTATNTQLVCRFINFWKSDRDDEEFRRLIQIVRKGTSHVAGDGISG